MPDYDKIYNTQAVAYEQLVMYEDYEHNLWPTIDALRPVAGLDVIDTGAGTGRLTALLAPHARSLRVFDLSPHMLGITYQKLGDAPQCTLAAADHRALPVPGNSADLIISGWSVCMIVGNYPDPDSWELQVGRALAEFERVLRPDGTLIIIETKGSGHVTPASHPHLDPYYAFLAAQGFHYIWIRTDFKFDDEAQALESASFFFGEEAAQRWVGQYGCIIPECTGIWWKLRG